MKSPTSKSDLIREPQAWSSAQAWLLSLVLLLGCVLAYHAVGGHGYVAYDDDTYVYKNPYVLQGISAEGLSWALTSASYGANWHPLTWISHMLDVQLFGVQRPGAAHWVNLLLHSFTACLFFWGLLRASGRPLAAFLAAALFAWHPLRVESVAWISERKDVLSGLMLALCIWSYASWTRRQGWVRYSCTAFFLALGLMAKPMLVSAPLLLLLLDAWPLGRLKSPRDLAARLVEKLPLLLLALLSAWMTLRAQSADGVISDQVPTSVTYANALASLATYLGQTLWPVDLACIYPLASSISNEPLQLLLLPASLGLLLLLGMSALAWRQRLRFPALAVGWLWYLISLAPVIGIVQVGDQAHADRYTYLPMLGLVAALALGLEGWSAARPGRRRLVILVSALLLSSLLWLSAQQVATWKNTQTLFTQALEVQPRNPVALGNLGYAHQQLGEEEVARDLFEAALRTGAPRLNVQLNLSTAYLRLGQLDQARTLLNRLRTSHPGEWRVVSNLGELEFRSQNLSEAERLYAQAIALGSDHDGDRLQLGLLLLQRDPAQARQHFNQALALNPISAKAYFALANLELREGKPRAAIPLLERSIALTERPPAQLLQALADARAQSAD